MSNIKILSFKLDHKYLIKELNEQGKTIIVVTHDKEVAKYCNKVIN